MADVKILAHNLFRATQRLKSKSFVFSSAWILQVTSRQFRISPFCTVGSTAGYTVAKESRVLHPGLAFFVHVQKKVNTFIFAKCVRRRRRRTVLAKRVLL